MSELVSVVVPVYNVEKYLARCLDSIIAQTYKNLEIILIDDGSTDSGGKICDDYAARDSRIRVIHQENVGLAEVRNVGIREAKGEYLQFVDSDDWVEPELVETCYKLSQEYDADIVTFRGTRNYDNGTFRHAPEPVRPHIIMSGTEALSMIMIPGYLNAASWNKFVKTSLYEGIEYPKGKLYEDLHTVYKYVAKARKVLCTSLELYHYFIRSASISNESFSARTYDLADAINNCYEFVIKRCGNDTTMRTDTIVGMYVRKMMFINHMVSSGRKSYDMEYIRKFQREMNPVLIMKCRHIKFEKKIQLLLLKYSISLYSFVFKKVRRDKA